MFRRRRTRLDEEIAAHVDQETADNIARGMDPVSARRAAMRTFGNLEAAKETVREHDSLYWLDTLWQDVRFACRLIARDRWLSLTIVATLTAGIAINVCVFTLVNGFLLRPWARSEPETFVRVHPSFSGKYKLQYSDGGMTHPDYVRQRDSAESLDSLAAYALRTLTLSGAESGSIRAGLVTCNLAHTLGGAPPLLGRHLVADECDPGNPATVVVLSESAWRLRFDADPAIVGRTILLNRIPFTVVGVAPSLAFPAPESDCEVWLPYLLIGRLRPADEFVADASTQWLSVFGRRRPGYSLQQVGQELQLIARRGDEEMPGRTTTLTVTDGSLIAEPSMRNRAPVILAVTLGTSTVLLLLACVNVTTLLLARSAARQREVAVRLSLGAGRFRLLRQLLTEGLVLSGIAAALSLLIAKVGTAAMWNAIASYPAPFDLSPDGRALLYCLVIAIAAGTIAGLSPAFESLRPHLSDSLKGSSGAVTPARRRSRLRDVLVAVQIALSLLLVVQVALFTRAQRRFFSYDPGFETKQVLNVAFASVSSGFTPARSFYQEVESRVAAVPGVTGMAYSSLAPWFGRNPTRVNDVDGVPRPTDTPMMSEPARRMVTSDYFSVVGLPLARGRAFTRDEISSPRPVVPAVISEAMAQRYWPGQDPVGHRFRVNTVHEVIGVVRNLQSVRFMEDDGPFYYVPFNLQRSAAYMLVRVEGDPQPAAAAIREIVRQVDPQMAVTALTLASIVETQGQRMKPVMVLALVAGGLALLLALTGVYAVVSFSVSLRTREIGIRTALGARRRDVVSLVLRSGAAPIAGGLAVGVGLVLAVSALMRSLLYGVNPRDPLTLTVGAGLLLTAALGAIWIPARRAAALDPLKSLRCE